MTGPGVMAQTKERYQGMPNVFDQMLPKTSQATPSSNAVTPSDTKMATLWSAGLRLAGSLRILTILPLTGHRVETHDGDMEQDLLYQSAPDRDGRWIRFLARVRASSLDHQLATGRMPRSGRVLAVRARQIVSPAGRRELAKCWSDVMDLASRPPVPLSPRGPLCRGRIAAAEPDLREMISVLTGGLPITARGAAMASWLLIDGTGPLHNHRSPLDLSAEARAATWQLTGGAEVWSATSSALRLDN